MPRIITTIVITLFFSLSAIYAQVGVGTTSPVGKLTVDASTDTTAALELVPQPVPTTNLTAGQIAVIGDKAYMYDATRMKWLSLESVALQFGRGGAANTNTLHHGGNMTSGLSGPLMPFDGTVVAITARGSAGDDTDVQLRSRNGTINNINETFTLTALQFLNPLANFDFNAGEYLTVRARDAATTTNNLTVTVWVKWRQ